MAQLPKAADLFADATDAKSSAVRMEEYVEVLGKSLSASTNTPGVSAPVDATAQLEALAANKSISPDALGALNSALAAQRQAQADIVKDISLTSPLSSSFAAFDLEAPAKLLTPRPTPLRKPDW